LKINIQADHDGMLLRDYMRRVLGFSRAMTIKLKTDPCGIMLNGNHVTVRAVIREGDVLEVASEDSAGEVNENILPSDLPVSIIYEDDSVIALNKPPHMPTHPSINHFDDTLANALAFYYEEKGVPFVFRAVTRLDGDTSGVVLIAKNKDAAHKLSLQFIEGSVNKTYIAVLRGTPSADKGKIMTYIRRAGESIILREVCGENEGGAYAETDYELLASKDGYSVVKVSPVTGRTHQIRLHFSYMGCPVAGDFLYGKEGERGLDRHALHAFSLEFTHPASKEKISVYAPLPEDMRAIIKDITNGKEIIF